LSPWAYDAALACEAVAREAAALLGSSSTAGEQQHLQETCL
jgi:hypothetical protein